MILVMIVILIKHIILKQGVGAAPATARYAALAPACLSALLGCGDQH